jgi:zinc transport system ATP-binding protein
VAEALRLDHVSYRYDGAENLALEDVSLTVHDGERLGILGPNGGGKSTLLKLALGQLVPTKGQVQLLGQRPTAVVRSQQVGYVAQQATVERAMPMTVRQAVQLAANWKRPWYMGVDRKVASRIDGLLELVGARAFADRPIGELSGGQLQRVLIARALAPQPRMLILDEPTVGIDAGGQQQFASLLNQVHQATNVTLLIVSHDLRAVTAGCDRVACVSRKVHFHAAPGGLTPQLLAELFAHEVAGVVQLAGMHIHAHGPGESCPMEPGASAGQLHQLGVPMKASAVQPSAAKDKPDART